ncbi:DUF1439 domain-containing protein [Marinobacter sp. R17]|uniref:DUF1439 domain-containing protein n=1 Tax=Marinobacter TaxID=2742 RepID=UPI000F4C9F88|nr:MULTISPECIES: DUF1439 domain-containing protein [Marinobacter]ROT98831.1 DUF1439 domain-containing protein [Marinobacter sp. R17]
MPFFQRAVGPILAFAAALTLSGCASLSPYSVSENTLEGYLQNAVADFDRQQLKAGSPLSVSLDQADITLGPDGREVAVLDIAGQVAVNAFMTKLPVDLKLKVEGAPVYDREERAVYIRRLKLLDSSIDSQFFKGDLKPVTDNVMRLVAQWLETVPVYRLDENSFAERMIGMAPVDVKVVPGKLVLVPAE